MSLFRPVAHAIEGGNMQSTSRFEWQGHSIDVSARASARYLWMNCGFEVRVDQQDVVTWSSWNGVCCSTRFKMQHQGRQLSGQVVSSSFPCTPIVTQATILDDSIIGHSQIWIKNRGMTYIILAAILLAIIIW